METVTKVKKVHPFFTKKPSDPPSVLSNLKWTDPPLGPNKTCLHGVHLQPEPREKVAAFDLDGTLIKWEKGGVWSWWRTIVPKALKKAYEEGFGIVIVTNQAGLKNRAQREEWQKNLEKILGPVSDLPFHVYAATARDQYRKPMIGIWHAIEQAYGVPIDKTQSYYVGDAAGRASDFAGTDRKWAENVRIPFYTPEEYFLKAKPIKYALTGFHPSSLPSSPAKFLPSNTPLTPPPTNQPEIVLFVGYPCVGKTTTFKRHFQPHGYVHVNQDTLKSRDRCIKAVGVALDEGKSCVVDNTNRNAQTRAYYVDLAKSRGVPIRCFHFTASRELATHNNLYRAYNLPPSVASSEDPRDVLPLAAIGGFGKDFVEPEQEEGFDEIKRVNWIWEGTEEEKRYWMMWLQVDGK